MLSIIVFVGFHNPNPWKSNLVKRPVMSASSKSIQTINHHDIEVIEITICQVINIARYIARGTVHLTTGKSPQATLGFGFDRTRCFRKDAHTGVVHDPIDAHDIANHVVIEHGLDVPAFGLGLLGENFTPEEALFFAR